MKRVVLSFAASSLLFGFALKATENNTYTSGKALEAGASPAIREKINLTITASNQSSETITNTTTDIAVVTASEIEERGDQTVAEAISRISGISITGNGGYGQPSTIFMRGQAAGNILILLDGMRLNDPSTTDGRAMIENLTTDAVAQIEVIKGGSSSIWGANAGAGVINIITKTPDKKGFGGSVSLKGGSHTTKGIDTRLSYGGEKFTALLLASYLKSDSFSALAPRDAESDGYTNKTANLKLTCHIDDHNHIEAGYYRVNAKGNYDDSYSALLANDSYAHYRSMQKNYYLQYRFGSGEFESTNRISRGTFDRDYFTNSFGNAQNLYRSTIDEFSSINSYRYNSGKLILGVEAKNIDGMNHYLSDYPAMPSKSDYKNRALFLSNTYHYGEDTLLETNLRYDYYDRFDNESTYKIGIKHKHRFLKGFTTKANYYTSYVSPSAYQLANSAPGELLEPSYSRGFDISANYREWITVTYFNTKVENPIDYDMDRFGYYNVGGKEKYSGIEIGGRYRLADPGVAIGANWTHLITYESYDTTALSNRAKEAANLSVDYFTSSNLHLNITGHYIGDRIDFAGKKTGNYSVWSANFDMAIGDYLKLYLHAKNLFDKEYETVYGYATEGRSLYAKLVYKF